jgi:hypothetical protein
MIPIPTKPTKKLADKHIRQLSESEKYVDDLSPAF